MTTDAWVGEVLADQFPLLRRVGDPAPGGAAEFASQLADGTPAVVRVEPASALNGAEVESRWDRAAQLAHPNLLRLYAAGRADLAGEPVLYAVIEGAEESLGEVLRARPLTPEETREMLPPALGALRYLHAHGWVHGALAPDNVLASGDTLKLSIASATPVGSSQPAEDVAGLGRLIESALRGLGNAQASTALPSPFAAIVQNTAYAPAEHRWSLDDIEAALDGRLVQTAIPFAEAPVLTEATAPVSAVTAAPAEPVRPTVREPRVLPDRPRPSHAFDRAPAPARERPRWLIPGAVAALLLLVAVIWSASHPTPKKAAPAETPAPAPVAAAADTPAPSTAASKPSPAPATPVVPRREQAAEAAAVAPRHAAHSGASSWYVVVATYGQRDQAEKRAHAITKKWPRFRAHVFDPPVENPHHLVVIGANLSQDGAESLRKRARAAGLPRDVYIKKFPG